MHSVEQWLDGLGLQQYARVFAENGIDARAIRHVTEQDLQALGVLLGHRRILLAAIGRLPSEAGPDGRTGAQADATHEVERRQLTVMFCDLVGSTELSEALDVEDYRELIHKVHETCAAVVSRYDGFLAKFMGDGLLVYFGYPNAHGDDAQRAARAALDIIAGATRTEIRPGRAVALRIGIATGEVVVGDLVVQGVREAASVLGATPNLAARLQGIAGVNQIVISEETRHRLPGGFAVEDRGRVQLKGIGKPVRVSCLLGLAEDLPATGGGAPFVGRHDALDRMANAWERARSGKLDLVVVAGQPGMGKSRLVDEFLARNRCPSVVRWRCSAYQANEPLHPVSPELLPPGNASLETGEAQRRLLLDTVIDGIGRLARKAPTVLFVEDAHWIDPTTVELLEQLCQRLADQAVLLVLSIRPSAAADRMIQTFGSAPLRLDALAPDDAECLVQSLSGDNITLAVRRQILARAGGSPLFLEELTRVVTQAGDAAIPASLQESLQARLDALGPAKRVAQIASAVGSTFRKTDLAALPGVAGVDLDAVLSQLVGSELLVEQEGLFSFRHALFQDVAYQSLLRSVRRRIHGKIADQVMAGDRSLAPEHVARHLSGAGRHVEAAVQWREAGRRSANVWAHAEAAAYYTTALQEASDLKDERWELEVRLDVVESLRILDRADEALMQLDRARSLIGRAGQDRDRLRLHLLSGSILFPLGRPEDCIAAHEDALAVAQRMGEPQAEARALSGLGDAHFASGRLVAAERTFDACVRLAESHGLDDITLANLSLRGHMRLYLCRLEEARTDCERAVEMAVSADNRRAEVMARGSCLGKVLLETGDLVRADEAFEAAETLAAEIGAHRYEALNRLFRGKVALEQGLREKALTLGRRAAVLAGKAGPRFCLPLALGVVARAETKIADCRAALEQAEELIAAGCFSHNPLWFYRDAALAAAEHGWAEETERYATALRKTFSRERIPWVDLASDGAEALAAWLRTGKRERLEGVSHRAQAAGLIGWARTLDAVRPRGSLSE